MIDWAGARLALAAAMLPIGAATAHQAGLPLSGGLAGRFLAKAAKPPAERQGERVVSGDSLVPVTVDGRSLRLRMEPAMPRAVLIAPALAPGLCLDTGKPGLFSFGVCYRLGHEATCGRTEVVRFAWLGGKAEKQRVGWMSRPYVPVADGSVGPGGLPETVIRFALHPARAGERTAVLPMRGGGLFGKWSVLEGTATIGGVPLRIRFDPHHSRSLANASAAIALAASNAGTMTTEAGRQEIAFGIERPYRVMRLARPLVFGGLSLDQIGVRTTDGDVAGRLAEEGAVPDVADPNEVVVTARKGKPPVNLLTLGADALDRCSSLVFDKPARTVALTCG